LGSPLRIFQHLPWRKVNLDSFRTGEQQLTCSK
jgi:hypothetical protein